MTPKDLLQHRFNKLESHYVALKSYQELIVALALQQAIYQPEVFVTLTVQEKALFDAYLKRFASMQDFLGAKIFPLLLDVAGIGSSKMSEVLGLIEKEEIIDSISHWTELRHVRNELEHDYPDDLQEALQDLKFCVNEFNTLQSYYRNVLRFADALHLNLTQLNTSCD